MLSVRGKCVRDGIAFNLPTEFFEATPKNCPQCKTLFGSAGYCTLPSVDRNNPELGYVVGNCEWLCVTCNRRKNDQSWAEMVEFAIAGFLRSTGG